MPETAPAPGTPQASPSAAAATATTPAGGVTAPVTPAAESLDALLQRERNARLLAEQRVAEQQRFIGRQTTEIGNLRKAVGGTPPGSPFMGDGSGEMTATERAGSASASLADDPVYEHDRKTRDFRDFMRDTSGMSPERRQKLMEIAADAARSREFEIRDAYNRIDYYRSYAAIADRLELDEFRAARAAAAGGQPATAPSAAPTGLSRTAGMLSGTSSVVAPGAPVDLATASADDLLTKGGLREFADPNDLPSALRR